jgi:signal transduction histidine kinase
MPMAVIATDGGTHRSADGRVMGVATAIAVASVVLIFLIESSWPLVSAIVLDAIGLGWAGRRVARRARSEHGPERRGWATVAVALYVAAAGLILNLVDSAVTGSIRMWGPQDLVLMAAYALGVAGTLQLPAARGMHWSRAEAVLDALILWVTIVAELTSFGRVGATGASSVLAAGIPLVDMVVVVALVIIAVRRASFRIDPRLALLAAGMAVAALADLTLMSGGRLALRLNLVLVAVAVLMFVGVALVPRTAPEPAIPRHASGAMVFPAVALIVVMALLAASLAGAPLPTSITERTAFLGFGTLALMTLATVRQLVAARGNRVVIARQREELISAVSHEIRTPLAAVLASLEISEEDERPIDDDERRELRAIALQQARYLAAAVEDIVLLARNRSGLISLDIRDVDLAAALSRLTQSVEDTSGVELRVDERLRAEVDIERVSQAVGNCLSNATRYGRGRVAVVATRRKPWIVIEIHDNGPGVPLRYRDIIWNQFERGSHRLDSQIQGSGIGLSVVETIAVSHGGTVGYRPSELLGGACFTITLPGG